MRKQISYKRIKKAVDDGIALNPHSILLTETGKIQVNGAFQKINKTKELVGIVYPIKTNLVTLSDKNNSASINDNNYEMILDSEADIHNDSRITTVVECKEGKFKATYINVFIIEEKIAGYQVGLERVD